MPQDTKALIERLRFCANLHPQVGYPENGKLFGEAADALETAQKRIDELEQHVADIIDDSGQECACGYDNPTDICMGHKPMFDKMQKRIERYEADANGMRNVIAYFLFHPSLPERETAMKRRAREFLQPRTALTGGE